MKFGVDYNFIMLRKTTEAIFDICPQTQVTGAPRGWLPGGQKFEKKFFQFFSFLWLESP